MTFLKTPRDIIKRRKNLKLLGAISLIVVFFSCFILYRHKDDNKT